MTCTGDPVHDYLIVARIRRAHGIRGECTIAIDTDRPEPIFRKGRVLHLGNANGVALGRRVTIEGFRPTPTGAILRLDGVTSREEAEALRGATLLIPAAEAQPAARDEVHYRDLVGMIAREGEREIGTVEDILELATGELLVVRSPEGKEILIPFVRDIVIGLNAEAGELRLRLPEGLLDI